MTTIGFSFMLSQITLLEVSHVGKSHNIFKILDFFMHSNSQMTQISYEKAKTRKQKVKHIVQNIKFIKIKSGI